MTEVAIRENLPAQSGLFDTGGRLDDLMWLAEIQHHGRSLTVLGIIKPDPSLKTAPELRRQLTDSYHKIVTILEEAGAQFWEYPKLSLEGKVFHACGVMPEVW